MVQEDLVADQLGLETELHQAVAHVLGHLPLALGAGHVRLLGEAQEPVPSALRGGGGEQDRLGLPVRLQGGVEEAERPVVPGQSGQRRSSDKQRKEPQPTSHRLSTSLGQPPHSSLAAPT